MNIRNPWPYLFIVTLVVSIVLGFLLLRSSYEISNTRKYETLKRSESDCKMNYEQLKSSYLELGHTQARILEGIMSQPEILKGTNPDYKDLNADELIKRVRRDIARLEVRIQDLENAK